MKRKQNLPGTILDLAVKAIFVFLVLCGFLYYVEYEWMMK